jgi:hypothetical protein
MLREEGKWQDEMRTVSFGDCFGPVGKTFADDDDVTVWLVGEKLRAQRRVGVDTAIYRPFIFRQQRPAAYRLGEDEGQGPNDQQRRISIDETP